MILQNIDILNKNLRKRRRILNKNSIVSFNRRLSVAENLKIIKYAEEKRIHVVSNYFGVSKPTIRC